MSGDRWNDRDPTHGSVAEAYRAAAFGEAPPENLDRAVLAHARRTAARRTFVPRPLHVAWAAVITLCVIVVLDVATPPDVPPDFGGRPPRAVDEAATAPEAAADQALETRQAAPEAMREFSRASQATVPAPAASSSARHPTRGSTVSRSSPRGASATMSWRLSAHGTRSASCRHG